MSQAIASARKRRGVPQQNPVPEVPQNRMTPSPQQQTGQNINAPGLTLPQVISLIDRRLMNLEKFAKESKETTVSNASTQSSPDQATLPSDLLEEFNNRFELLATEINNMKDIVLKLQSYTMDVNKTLLQERINVFSDLGVPENTENISFEPEDLDAADLTSVNLKSLVQQEFSHDFK
uniref:Uncharacterized protein n=1 Tax=viral metagenome TaxID=1070528 RepID=A0A6C0HAN9_9ZZZZ